MRYDRGVIAYHGCDEATAETIRRGEPFRPSDNNYDWLGKGIYFWEFGAARALRFAEVPRARSRPVTRPDVVGALLQLGSCFDLMHTHCTEQLSAAFEMFERLTLKKGLQLPRNDGQLPDEKLRRLIFRPTVPP